MCLTFLVITIGTLSCYVLFPPRIQTYTIPLVQSWMTTTTCSIFPQESILPRSYVGGWIEDGQNVYRLCLRTALWENRHHWVERGITRPAYAGGDRWSDTEKCFPGVLAERVSRGSRFQDRQRKLLCLYLPQRRNQNSSTPSVGGLSFQFQLHRRQLSPRGHRAKYK